jgi:hypothetical protein
LNSGIELQQELEKPLAIKLQTGSSSKFLSLPHDAVPDFSFTVCVGGGTKKLQNDPFTRLEFGDLPSYGFVSVFSSVRGGTCPQLQYHVISPYDQFLEHLSNLTYDRADSPTQPES